MLLPAPEGPTSPIISFGTIARFSRSITGRRAVTKADVLQFDFAAQAPGWTGRSGSGTLGTRSRISKIRSALTAAHCVAEKMRLIDSSRV